jgi:hypothetical protein
MKGNWLRTFFGVAAFFFLGLAALNSLRDRPELAIADACIFIMLTAVAVL